MIKDIERCIAVPKSRKGSEEYSRGLRDSDNIIFYRLPEDEFDRMYKSGVLWILNDRFDIFLDDYESGDINSDFEFVLAEAEKRKEGCPTFYEAAKQAAKYKVEICFEF